ncbi:SusD/RagB family nutrient-binding outer membrane lipoprotein [Pseudoflavitalea sp. X16]|uniref:SusD/RagB family nutrient-binding outer membrane lipoprotein n=1 Tax=Paraflavitalea devenefica TaxID=2716334 RepID=UPI00141DA945|nr:SusD/RagB family nutrient-binding outer membrane lipoprotein [Paraflavitalea devenefica]NII23564.1 SusD/RagB family nutrient-binding outer membrane lipoprotein [Paraflavitalea devenefica]
MTAHNKISAILFSLLLITITHTGCRKGWLDVNYNPGELTDSLATPDLVLPSLLDEWTAASGMDFKVNFNGLLNQWMGYWCEPLASPGNSAQTYNIVTTSWSCNPRISPLLLENKARRTNQTFYEGIARIIQALTWSRNVDVLNNIPYREAFKQHITQPKYDKGQFIYEELMKQLDTSIHLIKNAALDKNLRITTADIMFHGDKGKWVRFANTLKLRLLVHQANRPERTAYIQKEIDKILAEGSGFLNSGEDASVNPGYNEQQQSLLYQVYCRHNIYAFFWYAASANIVGLNFLKENNDPRLGFFYAPVQMSVPAGAPEPFSQPGPLEYRGNKFGLPVNEAEYQHQGALYVSQAGSIAAHGPVTPSSSGIFKGYNMNDWIMTSIESLFLQAEAVQRGWIPGDAELAYKNAVRESFRWLNVGGNSTLPELSDAVFNEWYNDQVDNGNPYVSWPDAPNKYKLLMFQKYLAFNGIEPFETWVDYRRNNAYPGIPLSADPGRVADVMPVRMPYQELEYINNAENVKQQGVINIFTSKIWWMPD